MAPRRRAGGAARASADTLFSSSVYYGGALVLYALRQKVGTAAFQRIERDLGARATTATSASHERLHRARRRRSPAATSTGFLRDWLYGTTTPPMPGHPDWKVDPVVEAAPAKALAARGAGSSVRLRP